MTSDLPEALISAGISTVLAYPGFGVDDVLARIDLIEGLDLIVTVAEPSAVAAAHAWWLVTGQPAVVLLSDGAGVEAALGMLALASREGAGIVVIVPGLLPNLQNPGLILAAVGATVVGLSVSAISDAVHLAKRGHVVAAVPGWSGTPSTGNAGNAGNADAGRSRQHAALVIGARATPEELREAAAAHTCSVITTPGVLLPDVLRPRWLGATISGSDAAVFDLIGLGDQQAGCIATVGCATDFPDTLRSMGSDVGVVDWRVPSQCLPARPMRGSGNDLPVGLPLCDALLELARRLPSAILVADAGASHRLVPRVGLAMNLRMVSTLGPTTMGWGPGAALGAFLAGRAPVILSIGDGALAMAGLDLLSWRQQKVSGVVVAAQNGVLGSVRVRLGSQHPQVTRCDLATADLFEALRLPWMAIPAGESPTAASAWAAEIVDSGGLACLVVDTTGHEVEEYRLDTGIPWWDRVTDLSLKREASRH